MNRIYVYVLTGGRWRSLFWIANAEQTASSSVIVVFVVYTLQQWLRIRVFGRIILKNQAKPIELVELNLKNKIAKRNRRADKREIIKHKILEAN